LTLFQLSSILVSTQSGVSQPKIAEHKLVQPPAYDDYDVNDVKSKLTMLQ